MSNEARMEKLKKDIETVLCWRKFGKALNKEQQAFASSVADEMIAIRTEKKSGAQLVSGDKIRFIKGMQPIQGSDAVAGITQDAVANVQTKSGKFPKKTNGQTDERDGVAKVAKPSSDPSAKETLPSADAKDGKFPKSSPDVQNISLNCPKNCKCGEVSAVADEKTDPKELSADHKSEINIEEIGHQPNLPMPKKMAEELIANANWGVDIGAYTNVKEGITRQLGRKDYAEYIDTDVKLKEVMTYLNDLTPNVKAIPVA